MSHEEPFTENMRKYLFEQNRKHPLFYELKKYDSRSDVSKLAQTLFVCNIVINNKKLFFGNARATSKLNIDIFAPDINLK